MPFNYWSVYVLLVFLLNRNGLLNRRWPASRLDMLRFMTRTVVLWKLRGVLLAATSDDILDAYLCGFFWNRDLLDSVVRVLRARGWHTNPLFEGIFKRRGKLYKRLPAREQLKKGFEGRADTGDHKDDSEVEDDYLNRGDVPRLSTDFIQTGDAITGPSERWRYDSSEESEPEQPYDDLVAAAQAAAVAAAALTEQLRGCNRPNGRSRPPPPRSPSPSSSNEFLGFSANKQLPTSPSASSSSTSSPSSATILARADRALAEATASQDRDGWIRPYAATTAARAAAANNEFVQADGAKPGGSSAAAAATVSQDRDGWIRPYAATAAARAAAENNEFVQADGAQPGGSSSAAAAAQSSLSPAAAAAQRIRDRINLHSVRRYRVRRRIPVESSDEEERQPVAKRARFGIAKKSESDSETDFEDGYEERKKQRQQQQQQRRQEREAARLLQWHRQQETAQREAEAAEVIREEYGAEAMIDDEENLTNSDLSQDDGYESAVFDDLAMREVRRHFDSDSNEY